jgi:hypothetical protein
MVGEIGNHCRVLWLFRVQRLRTEGVRVVSVEVYEVGIVADRAGNSVVAQEISAIRVGKRVDIYVNAVYQVGILLVRTIAAEEGINEMQHHDVAGNLVTMHRGGIEKLGIVNGISTPDYHAED